MEEGLMDAATPAPPVSRWAWPVLLGLVALYLAHCFHFREYVNDDAYITFRYSRFLAMGRGPYFNIGEHVEGYTNCLLMLLMVPVIALLGPDAAPVAAKALGVACGAVSMLLAAGLAWRIGRRAAPSSPDTTVAGLLAAGLLATSLPFAINSVSGLETLLYGLGLTAGVFLGTSAEEQERWHGAGVAFAAALLTRPEGALLFAVYWTAQLAIGLRAPRPGWRRRLAIDTAIVAVVFLAHLAFRRVAYDGEWLPNTYYAKLGGFWGAGAAPYITSGILCVGGLTGAALATLGWLLGKPPRADIVPVAAVAVTGVLLPFVTGTDWMLGARLLVPYLPLAAVVLTLGWLRLTCLWPGRPAWLAGVAATFLVSWLAYLQTYDARWMHAHESLRARGYAQGHAALANWLRTEAAQPGDWIALMDIGIVGYRCIDQQILDISGLTDRYIAKSPGKFLQKEYDVGYLLARAPRFVVVVLKAPGDPDQVPAPEQLRLSPWSSRVEGSILNNAEFQRWYMRPAKPAVPGEPWLSVLAKELGATRVFLHTHPGAYYLLTVFERQHPA
jgi:hypothetical protein